MGLESGESLTFGALLRTLRTSSGKTQRAFGAEVGYSATHIARLEQGKRQTSPAIVRTRFIPALRLKPDAPEALLLLDLLRGSPKLTAAMRLSQAPGQVPRLADAFVGRKTELSQLQQLFRAGNPPRVLTLLGPGGSGKTRLASELAASAVLPGQVLFVDLAAAETRDDLIGALARSLGDTAGARNLTSLVTRLSEVTVTLLLDNCENATAACVELLTWLFDRCAQLRVLATSRSPLHMRGELVQQVPPLSQEDAVALFVARMRDIGADQVDAADVDLIRDICERLDRMPLAIELAAAQTDGLSLRQLADRMRTDFVLRMSNPRDADGRHANMQHVIDWTYDRLEPDEARLLLELSVFSGGATLAAVEAVCGRPDGASPVADVLLSLLRKSLVSVRGRGAEQRYVLLEPVRQYARAKLTSGHGDQTLQLAHLAYFARHAQDCEHQRHNGADNTAYVLALRAEEDNIRAALDWLLRSPSPDLAAAGDDAVALVIAMFWYWYDQMQWEYALTCVRGLALKSPTLTPLQRARALICSAEFLGQLDRRAEGAVDATAGTQLAREHADWPWVVMGEVLLSWFDKSHTHAMQTVERVLAEIEHTDLHWHRSVLYLTLGAHAVRANDAARARTAFMNALEITSAHHAARGNRLAVLLWLGELALQRQDNDEARRMLNKARDLAKQRQSLEPLLDTLWLSGVLAIRTGDWQALRHTLVEAMAVHDRAGRAARPELFVLLAALERLDVGDREAAAQYLKTVTGAIDDYADEPNYGSKMYTDFSVLVARLEAAGLHNDIVSGITLDDALARIKRMAVR